jgi:hypothetical protein
VDARLVDETGFDWSEAGQVHANAEPSPCFDAGSGSSRLGLLDVWGQRPHTLPTMRWNLLPGWNEVTICGSTVFCALRSVWVRK